LNSGKIGDARAAFENAQRLDPSSTAALMGLAEMARFQNDAATAEPLLREVLAGDPQSVPALWSYALLELGRRHWAEALEWQKKRIAADTDPPVSAQLVLAELMWRTGDMRDAEREYIDILKRDAYNTDAHYLLGEIFRRQKRWEEARVQLKVVVRYFPAGNPQAYISLADVYRNLGRTRDAVLTLEKGERIFPGNSLLVRAADAD
jgi:cytochrome c-type biogenesis protein CcmH/NrfG